MRSQIRPALMALLIFTVLTGLLYPLVVTGIAQLAFPHQANGSLIVVNGKTVGSTLIGQQFTDPKYFWGRLSATGPYPYNAAASSGSNLGPTNPALLDEVKARIAALKSCRSRKHPAHPCRPGHLFRLRPGPRYQRRGRPLPAHHALPVCAA